MYWLLLYFTFGIGTARLVMKAHPVYRELVSGLIVVLAWPFYLLAEVADVLIDGLTEQRSKGND